MKLKTKKLTIIINGLICLIFVAFYLAAPTGSYAVTRTCSGGNCWYTECQQNSDCGTNYWTGARSCQGNDIYQNYITYTCNSAGTADAYCSSSITTRHQTSCGSGQICRYGICIDAGSGAGTGSTSTSTQSQPQGQTYYPHYYRQCVGNSVYWFDSNNRQQDLYQFCSPGQGCSGGSCVSPSNYSQPATYNYHATKGCFNNVVYWYDSLGNRQDAYQNCSQTGQICQDGLCFGQTRVISKEPVQGAYALHYVTKCYNDSIYWHDSKGSVQNLYKSCSDDNQCTEDFCQEGQCKNILKCDGSTCKIESDDYLKYCPDNQEKSTAVAAVSEGKSFINFKNWYLWVILAIIFSALFVVVFKNLSSKV